MNTSEMAFNMHHGGSLYGSQGNLNGSRTFAAILQRIVALKEQKTGAKEKARIILDIISMLKDWCGINTLGVRSLEEEFQVRYEQYLPGRPIPEDKIPKLISVLPMNLRIIPLYAPNDGNDNYLSESEKIEGTENSLHSYRLLFVDTEGKIVCFIGKQLCVNHMIEHEHEVAVAYVTEDELADYLGEYHLMFDYCLRELIRSCNASIDRANERALSARRGCDALVIIAEEMRRDDLTTAILLSEENQRGMPGCKLNQDIFRRLAKQAGRTPEVRLVELERQLKILGRKDITGISHLNLTETMQIIHEEEPAKN